MKISIKNSYQPRFSVNFHQDFHGHHPYCQSKAHAKYENCADMQCAWFSVWQVLPLAVPVYDITCFGVVVKLEEFFVVCPHSSCVKTMWSGLLFFLLGLIQVNNGQQSPPKTQSRGCSSRSGKPCVFPFFYNGTLYDGEKRNCTQRKNNVSSVQNTVG